MKPDKTEVARWGACRAIQVGGVLLIARLNDGTMVHVTEDAARTAGLDRRAILAGLAAPAVPTIEDGPTFSWEPSVPTEPATSTTTPEQLSLFGPEVTP